MSGDNLGFAPEGSERLIQAPDAGSLSARVIGEQLNTAKDGFQKQTIEPKDPSDHVSFSPLPGYDSKGNNNLAGVDSSASVGQHLTDAQAKAQGATDQAFQPNSTYTPHGKVLSDSEAAGQGATDKTQGANGLMKVGTRLTDTQAAAHGVTDKTLQPNMGLNDAPIHKG
jgi:hypothetical protein